MDDNNDQKGLWLPGQASVPYTEMSSAYIPYSFDLRKPSGQHGTEVDITHLSF